MLVEVLFQVGNLQTRENYQEEKEDDSKVPVPGPQLVVEVAAGVEDNQKQ